MSTLRDLQFCNNETTRVFVCRNGAVNDNYPIIEEGAICNIRCGSSENFSWYFENLPSIFSAEDCTLGEYGVLRHLREQTAGLHYVGIARYNAYLNLNFKPYVIEKEEYNFSQPFTAHFSDNASPEDCGVCERMGHTAEHIETLFHDHIKIIVSAPVPSSYSEYLSPLELMEKEYAAGVESDQQEELVIRLKDILFQVGRFIPSVQDESNSLLSETNKSIQDSWNAFLDRFHMDFVFFGSLAIMERQWFESYVDFVSQTLDTVQYLLGDEVKELCRSRSSSEFYQQLGNLLTAFFLYEIANAALPDCRVAITPTAVYDTVGALLTDLYPASKDKSPQFLFRSQSGASILLNHPDEINAMVEKGYLFDSMRFSTEDSLENTVVGADFNYETSAGTEEDLTHFLQLKYPSYVGDSIVPFFSIYNSEYNDYICTSSFEEMNQARKDGYQFDQFLGYVFSPDITDQTVMDTPIYRLHLKSHHDHVYTIDKEECDAIQQNDWYTYEGIAGYEFFLTGCSLGNGRSATATTKPIHRYWCASCVSHRYSISDEAVDMNQFQKEGICFHTVTFTADQPVKQESEESSLNSASLLAAGSVSLLVFFIFSTCCLFYIGRDEEPDVPSSLLSPGCDYRIYVIHDGRPEETFPIFSAPSLYSIMEGTYYAATDPGYAQKHPNIGRRTTLRDNEGDNIGKDEYLYSEFSSLYNIWSNVYKNKTNLPKYFGKMHYRSYLNLSFFGKDDALPLMDKEETRPAFKGADLPQIEDFDDPDKFKDSYLERMGYTSENLQRLLSGNGSIDALISTPDYTDFQGVSITEQFLNAHSFDEQGKKFNVTDTPCQLALLKLLIKAGEFICSTELSDDHDRLPVKVLNDPGVNLTENFKAVFPEGSYGKETCISSAWSHYIGLLHFLKDNSIIKNEMKLGSKIGVPYMKDLFLFKTPYFNKYMEFVYTVLSRLKESCKPIIDHYRDKALWANKPVEDADSRLLAFIGERLTGYFIHHLVTVENARVALAPRAHYTALTSFLTNLYPICSTKDKSVTLIPVFEFYKPNQTNSTPGITRYISGFNHIAKTESDGFYFERCIGYISDPASAGKAGSNLVELFETAEGGRFRYKTLQKGMSAPKDRIVLGFLINSNMINPLKLEKKDPVVKTLYRYEFGKDIKFYIRAPKDSPYKVQKNASTIALATFNRSDIIIGI